MTIDIEKLRAELAAESRRVTVQAIGIALGCVAAGAAFAILVQHVMGKVCTP